MTEQKLNDLKKRFVQLNTRYEELRDKLSSNPDFEEWNYLRIELDGLQEQIEQGTVEFQHQKDSTSQLESNNEDWGGEQADDLREWMKALQDSSSKGW